MAEHLANIVHDNEIDEAYVVVSPVQNSQLLNLVYTALHIRTNARPSWWVEWDQ